MRTNRRRKRGYLFLFLILAIAVVLFTIPIYLLMDSGSSLERVNKLTHGETKVEKPVKVEKKVEPKKVVEELGKTAKSVVDTAVDFVESLDKENGKEEAKVKKDINTSAKKKKDKTIFSYWWEILIAIWLLKSLFGRS